MGGEGDRYEWKNIGSNYPVSELNAAMLYAQLENTEKINSHLLHLWNLYNIQLKDLEHKGLISLPKPAQTTANNGHCFFIKVKDGEEKKMLVKLLLENNIEAKFHYTPLHSSKFGKLNGRFAGEDRHTTKESQRLLRLPLFYAMQNAELDFVTATVKQFYNC
jgi:dTDP-4-amino-4,6-dideoxygalactose transaminase